jgi:histidine triad (HIT) family protein
MRCVVCEIAAGRVAAAVVHRSDDAVAFLPEDGLLAPGHCLVAPVAHAKDLFEVNETSLHATMVLVTQVSKAMLGALGAGGVTVLHAGRPDSAQSVFHLHFHVVPRWREDGCTTWPDGRSNVEPIGDVEGRLSLWLNR